MNLRHKRNYSRLQSMEPNFQPVVGLFNTVASLNCHIKSQSHQFNIEFIHPLEILNKITKNFKKYALDQIIATTYDIKIESKNTFIPEALLAGDTDAIHEYKKLIERSRIGAYIKMNLKHQEKSYEKKKQISSDSRIRQKSTVQNHIFSKAFNQTNFNQRQIKNTKQYLTVNAAKANNQPKNYANFTPDKQNRSFTVLRTQHTKLNQQNSNLHIKIEQRSQIRTVNHTHIHNVKKTSSTKKSRGIDGIKINYIAIKGSQQNPQTSTFIYKSTTQRTNQERSQFDAKTQFNSPHVIHFDKTLDNDISFSVNDNDKFSVHSKFKEVEDNLSEKFEKSMKNSEISEMTHREMYTKDYFANDQKILKKGRKIVCVENFQTKEMV